MINILKQLVRTRTDIELQPSGYSFPYIELTVIAITRASVIKLSFGHFWNLNGLYKKWSSGIV